MAAAVETVAAEVVEGPPTIKVGERPPTYISMHCPCPRPHRHPHPRPHPRPHHTTPHHAELHWATRMSLPRRHRSLCLCADHDPERAHFHPADHQGYVLQRLHHVPGDHVRHRRLPYRQFGVARTITSARRVHTPARLRVRARPDHRARLAHLAHRARVFSLAPSHLRTFAPPRTRHGSL